MKEYILYFFSKEYIDQFGKKNYFIMIYLSLLGLQFIASYPVFYNIDWYLSLERSHLTPQSWVFRAVWNVLYFCMALILYLYAKSSSSFKWQGLKLFALQLVFNVGWNYVFFITKNFVLSMLTSLILDLLVIKNMFAATKINKYANCFFALYFIWLCYASMIMFDTLQLNYGK